MTGTTPAQTTIRVSGMTCAHCEVAVERALRGVAGIQNARASYADGSVSIESNGPLDEEAVAKVLAEEGYAIGDGVTPIKGSSRRYAEAAAALILVLALMLMARQFDWPRNLSVTDHMTLGFVFVIGLLASVSTCMAVTGGLLIALAAKYNETATDESAAQRFVPHLYFNAGRLISYAGFGALIGFAGAALTLSPLATGILTLIVSAVMIVIGLQMLKILPPLRRLLPIVPKSALHRIHDLVERKSKASAFTLGAATFFLPCGFTLALQLYVLSKGSAALGAATMLVFALGTLPALLSLSALSSFASGVIQSGFLRLAGAAVIVLGFMNIQYGLVQTGSGYTPLTVSQNMQPASAAEPVQARQVVEMRVRGFAYEPNRFVVKAGLPVEWRIDAREAEGCGRVLVARSIGIMKILSSDQPTVITFTPKRPGEIAFNCSMGMMTPNSGFSVIE